MSSSRLASARLLAPLPLLALSLVQACGDSGTPPEGGLDLEAVFAPATSAEIAAVEADWSTRAPGADGVLEELVTGGTLAGSPATVRVYSHLVDGYRHYGAMVVPDGAASGSLPVVVFAHPGDGGMDMGDFFLAATVLGEVTSGFVFVVPSFRSETLTVGSVDFESQGDPSPWDRDVDDALALLDVALQQVPEADPERIGAVGISRGAGVALLMAARDPRVDLVVELSGPTDFFGPYVRGVVEDALDGRLRPLPGLAVLDQRFIQPLAAGTLPVADFRMELARRSVVLFADRLPPVQVHHGRLDQVVDVSQAESLVQAIEAAGGGPPRDGFYLYDGAGHDPLTMTGSFQRAADFLSRLTQPLPAGVRATDVPRAPHLSVAPSRTSSIPPER